MNHQLNRQLEWSLSKLVFASCISCEKRIKAQSDHGVYFVSKDKIFHFQRIWLNSSKLLKQVFYILYRIKHSLNATDFIAPFYENFDYSTYVGIQSSFKEHVPYMSNLRTFLIFILLFYSLYDIYIYL